MTVWYNFPLEFSSIFTKFFAQCFSRIFFSETPLATFSEISLKVPYATFSEIPLTFTSPVPPSNYTGIPPAIVCWNFSRKPFMKSLMTT